MLLIVIILKLISVFEQGDGARILAFFPMPMRSHHRLFQPLLRELAVRGHQVTYFTPYEMISPPDNLKQIIVVDIYNDMMKDVDKLPWLLKDYFTIVVGTYGTTLGKKIFSDDNFQNLIASDEKFDLVLAETSLFHEVFSPLVHRFNASLIEVLPPANIHWSWYLNGNPYDTSYIINLNVAYTDRMNLMQKIDNTVNSILSRWLFHFYFIPKYQIIADQQFRYPGWEARPPIDQLIRSSSLVLVNSHHSLNYPYPLAPHFKEIGGINIQTEPQPLSKELKQFMDEATDGVIYFTLGSHFDVSKILDGNLVKIFKDVFGGLKQRVLWKWEIEFPDLPPNIRISKWFPQQDVLGHKNIKIFISHGGYLSQTESIYYGVPIIGIPIKYDQFKNIKHVENFGYGLQLQLENITTESLSWAINHILSNPSYAINARKRSDIYKDKIETPLETAVYWTEYVIRHKGAAHLKPAIASMPWYQQAMIDVYAAIAAIILIPIYVIYKSMCYYLKRLFTKKKYNFKKAN